MDRPHLAADRGAGRRSRTRRPGRRSPTTASARRSTPGRRPSSCIGRETANYRDNLSSGAPALWVVLRETGAEPPYALYLVTADPAEGEGMTAAGNNIVEPVPMPQSVRDTIANFVADHHVEETFEKRKLDRADLEALGRHGPSVRKDER